MVMASDLSARLGLVAPAFVERIRSMCLRAGLPVRAPSLGGEQRWLELMRIDKKAEGGALRFVVIESPGKAALKLVPDALVRETLIACCD
jgi:3-dehydroquinate synthase